MGRVLESSLVPTPLSRVAYLRPSSAATWLVCSGSVVMREAFPETSEDGDSDVTEDGTACHWLASEIWEVRFPEEGSLSPNHRVLTEEMFEGVDMYHDTLRCPRWAGADVYCEKPMRFDFIWPGMTGTPDAWTYHPQLGIRVVDLKFGFRFVEVMDNTQLSLYALAVGRLLQLPPSTPVELVIVQPRANHRSGPVRTWRTTLGQLELIVQPLRDAAARAMSPHPMCVANPGCLDCAGAHACDTFHNATWGAVELTYAASPHLLSPQELGRELSLLDEAASKIKARLAALKVQAEDEIRRGKILPGWDMGSTYAREGWRSPEDERAAMALAETFFKTNISKPRRALTPNQARAKGFPASMTAVFAHRASTGMKLMKQDPKAARKAFEQHPIERGNGND